MATLGCRLPILGSAHSSFFVLGHGASAGDLEEVPMKSYRTAMAAVSLGCAALTVPVPASALDIGGQNGISVGSSGSGLGVSVGGANGVNASVEGTSNGGLGVNASVGGSTGVNSNTSIGGSSGGLGVNSTARVGGSRGVNADVDATVGGSSLATASANARVGGSRGLTADVDADVGGSRLATASADVGVGRNTLLNVLLGVPATGGSVTPGGRAGGSTSSGSGLGNSSSSPSVASSRTVAAINDMSAADRAKAKLRCKDVLRSGGYEASLTKLCKMVVGM